MKFSDKKNEIRQLLANDKLMVAIDKLITISQYEDQSTYQEMILLKAQHSKLTNDTASGLLTSREESLQRSKIRSALFQVIENFSIDPNKIKTSEIRNLIANGNLKEGLVELENFYTDLYPEDLLQLRNGIILLNQRLHELTRKVRNGMIQKNDSDIEYNRLIISVLEFLDEINSKTLSTDAQFNNSEQITPIIEKRQKKNASSNSADKIAEIVGKESIDLYADLDQVKPVFGDIFRATFDLIVIPKNGNGGISISMQEGMERMGYNHDSKESTPGDIEIMAKSKKSKIAGHVCYAISVEPGNSSSLKIIEKLGKELGKLSLGSDGFKNIATPLLGTGAGGLDKIEVFHALEKSFKSSCDNDASLSIYILDKEIFDPITKAKRDKLFGIIIQSRSRFDTDNVFGDDQLGITHEVDSFANLIISSELEPPLSIGLFGNWGTGKSFFMEKLSDKVKKLKTDAINDIDSSGICKNIVQIKFNAWYYVDANLWASMVSNIFEELSNHLGIKNEEEKQESTLYEQLASTEEQVRLANAEADRYSVEIQTLDQEIKRLKDERQLKRQNLEEVRLSHILEEIEKDNKVAEFIKNAKDKLGFAELNEVGEKAQRSVEDIEGLIQRYQSTHGRVIQVYKSIVSFKSWKSILLLVFLLIIPFIAYYLIGEIKNIEKAPILKLIGQLGSFVAAISLFIRNLIDQADPILQNVNTGVEYLNKAKSRLQNIQDVASSESDEEIAMLKHEYEQLNEEHQKAISQKWSASKKLKLIKKEIDEIKTGKRLNSFIQKRVQSNDYQNHLGLISIVRKDFDRLSKYLQSHRTKEALAEALDEIEGTDKIDRIILYIDDLDRCPPEKVVDVLQAIHLILAFPLFVVVVGVDVRWVSKSLLKKYGKMLSSQDSELSDDPELKMELQGSATPYDYLEKIFQIPFKLKNINEVDKIKYIAKLLENDLKIEGPSKPIKPEMEFPVSKEELLDSTQEESNSSPLPTKADEVQEKQSENDPIAEEENVNIDKQDENNSQIKKWDTVHLTKEEFDFAIGLSPIAGNSARTLKRFVNLARLIKSNKNWIPNSDAINTRPYNACLFMLAVVVGSPWMFPLFFSLIKEEKNEESDKKATTLEQLVKKKEIEIGKEIDKHGHINKEWDNLRLFLENIEDHENVDVRAINSYNLNYLRKIAPIVSRFSFRVLEDVEVSNFLKQLKNE